MTIDFDALAAPFRAEDVHWRAQTVTCRDGKYFAMALAYMDARDVMARLDEVCGPANWQTAFTETAKGRVICSLSLRIDGEWIAKADGAGETDVEGEKGALSDALKRAAVHWGIGRYLYDLEAVWGDCDGYSKGDKHYFRKWLPSALAKFRQAALFSPPPRRTAPDESTALMLDLIAQCDTELQLERWSKNHGEAAGASADADKIRAAYAARKKAIEAMNRIAA